MVDKPFKLVRQTIQHAAEYPSRYPNAVWIKAKGKMSQRTEKRSMFGPKPQLVEHHVLLPVVDVHVVEWWNSGYRTSKIWLRVELVLASARAVLGLTSHQHCVEVRARRWCSPPIPRGERRRAQGRGKPTLGT